MSTQRLPVQLPPLTAAHLTQFRSMIADIAENGQMAEHDTALLTRLVADLPRLRSTQPADVQDALQVLDQNDAVLTAALDGFKESMLDIQDVLDGARISAHQMVQSAALAALAERVHAVSQAAAEVALRAKERSDMLRRHERAP